MIELFDTTWHVLDAVFNNPFGQMAGVIIFANVALFGTLWVRGDWR